MRDRSTAHSARGAALGAALRRIAIVFFAAISVSCVLGVAAAQAQQYRFDTIRVDGNQRLSDRSVAGYAGIAPGETVSAGDVNDAYQNIVNTGLFESVEVTPSGNTLIIRVEEYPIIGEINFEGNNTIDDEELAGFVQSQENRAYSPATAEEDATALTELYRRRGRFSAEITPKIIQRPNDRVDLAFEIAEGGVVEIERLSFVGNRNYSDSRLRRVLQTKQAGLLRWFLTSDTFLADRIEADKQLLRDFYRQRGYIDFEVLSVTPEMSRERDAFFLTFNIREGQSFTINDVSVTSEIEGVDPAPYQAELNLDQGATFSPVLVENNITRLERLADRQGERFVRVEPRISRNERDLSLDIEFALMRGERVFVERIDIEGNTTTQDRVIRRQFRTVEGDPLNPREIRRSAERVRALAAFSDASVETRPGSSDEQVIVDVNVQEQPTGSLGFGLSYGVDAGLGAAVTFSEKNLLGRGQQLDVSLGLGVDNQDTSITFTEPAFLGRDVELSLSAYYSQTEGFNVDYDTRRIGISPSLEFPVSELGRLSVNYTLSKDTLRNLDAADSSPILGREAQQGEFTSSVGYSYSYDTRDGGLDPITNYYLRFGQDFAGLGGDQKHIRTVALGGVERKIFNEDVTLRAELEGGNVSSLSGDTRIFERFFMNDRIRGFDFNGLGPRDLGANNRDALGGNNFAVARFEADFPLGLPEEYGINGGLFLDVGTVWGLDDTAGAGGPVDDDPYLRSTIGFSVFWDTPIGPLRFNFSQPLRKKGYDDVRNFDLRVSTRF